MRQCAMGLVWMGGVLCGGIPLARAQSTPASEQRSVSSTDTRASSVIGPEKIATDVSFASVRRAILVLVPSFSPYHKIVYAWSKQGTWMLASTDASWPPPIPKFTASTLMDSAQDRRWVRALNAVMRAGHTRDCASKPSALSAGEGWLRVEMMDAHSVRCVMFKSDAKTARYPHVLRELWAFAPSIPSVNRWSQPFWLQNNSGMLRLELTGTAAVSIDGDDVGRVNGVLLLRVPNGNRHVVLTPLDGGSTRRVDVAVHPHQTTILRISVADETAGRSPSWYDEP